MSSLNNKEHNKRVLDNIINGNKIRREEETKRASQRQEEILSESLKFMDSRKAVSLDDAEKKLQNVVEYYHVR